MATPQRTLTPKNYISPGISKKLLTPCRRVGLSRSKKTPRTRCADGNTPKKPFGLENDLCDQTSKDEHTGNSDSNVESQSELKFQVVSPKSPVTVQPDSKRCIDFNDDNINNKLYKPKDVSALEHNPEDKFRSNKHKCKKLKMDSTTKNSDDQALKPVCDRSAMEEHQAEQAKARELSEKYLEIDVPNPLENKTDCEESAAVPACINSSMENLSVDQDHLAPLAKSVVLENGSDDELFTSSPESDKKQRENLCKLISKMEREVEAKKETVESLKRAQTYKKLHNLEELQNSTEQWLRGCRLGLQDLLRKRQEHEEIQMESLMVKLRIPDDIIIKLNLS
ncbi:hypothetical protein D910_06216 [Dendroctonus ponderosae]|uniref:Meiosis protein 5 homolog n=1 Tax=Dendroctonus ponderosae TaxID=77166 RepID=U4U4N5_DENPD|nr:hypothetical protein D910_06216 [Dendroctonus ponderosae]KAH1017936.1 hypothetical protein HUJ05_008516 [Dendroctonus ponderosae]